jgi:hypothetical protein
MLAVIRGPCLAEGLDTDYAVRSVVAEPVGETGTTNYGIRTAARIEEKHS